MTDADPGALGRMLLSRRFEEKVRRLFEEGALHGTTHLNIGQEASHTGLCDALDSDDWIVPTHRCHGFNVARGSDISAMFSELLGSRRGLCGGLGGSMHMTDTSTRNFGSSAVVGSGVALAAGIAFALSRSGRRNISVAILGDGATSRGVVHECMNLASVWSLPLLFYCENNHYGMSASSARMISTRDISSRARGYSMVSFKCDGNDYDDVLRTVKKARAHIMANGEPAFVEADTYRQCGHSKSDSLEYRTRDEEEQWARRDPIVLASRALGLGKEAVRALSKDASDKVEAAWQKALETARETFSVREMEDLVLAPAPEIPERRSGMRSITYRMAINEALDEILASDPKATLIGEDIGLYGGCFGVTRGLAERHTGQVLETPVSEEAFTGLAAGAAAMGERPIVEMMYGDFCTLASDPIVNHAAKLRFMSAGQLSCPMVLRAPMGSGTGHGSQHTQSLEAMFLNVPGLKIVCPSDPFTAKALLKAAHKDPNPVLYCEHKALYGTAGEAGDSLSSFPIGKAQVLREGDEVTLISYSRATLTCKKALSLTERSVEHIDLATIKPLDWDTIRASAMKTGRVVIVQDTPLPGSVGATVAAMLACDPGTASAKARVVSGRECPTPFARSLEEVSVPGPEDVLAALREA